MKKSVIKEVFNGFRGTAELMAMTEEEHKLLSVASDTYDEFLKELTPKQKELHDKFIDARESASCEELDNYYVEGFKLGLLIGIECMDD